MPYTPAGTILWHKVCVFCGEYGGMYHKIETPYCLQDNELWAWLAWQKVV